MPQPLPPGVIWWRETFSWNGEEMMTEGKAGQCCQEMSAIRFRNNDQIDKTLMSIITEFGMDTKISVVSRSCCCCSTHLTEFWALSDAEQNMTWQHCSYTLNIQLTWLFVVKAFDNNCFSHVCFSWHFHHLRNIVKTHLKLLYIYLSEMGSLC